MCIRDRPIEEQIAQKGISLMVREADQRLF